MKSRTQMPNSAVDRMGRDRELAAVRRPRRLVEQRQVCLGSRVIGARALPSAFMPSTSHRDPAEIARVDAKAIRVPTCDQAGDSCCCRVPPG